MAHKIRSYCMNYDAARFAEKGLILPFNSSAGGGTIEAASHKTKANSMKSVC